MTRSEAISAVAREKMARNQIRYRSAMIEAEETVRALEVLGLLKLDPDMTIKTTPAVAS